MALGGLELLLGSVGGTLKKSSFYKKMRESIWVDNVVWRYKARMGSGLVPAVPLTRSYREALRLLRQCGTGNAIGDYLEFGVCHGSSMICMDRALKEEGGDSMRLFGFDSFEGLPSDADHEDGGVWRPGSYRSSLSFARRNMARAGVDMGRVHLVKGWFKDTLTPETAKTLGLTRAGIVMIDCDLYSAAREALAFTAPLIRERAVILFDDWHTRGLADRNAGERRAFSEFLAEHPRFRATELETYCANAAVFLVEDQRS